MEAHTSSVHGGRANGLSCDCNKESDTVDPQITLQGWEEVPFDEILCNCEAHGNLEGLRVRQEESWAKRIRAGSVSIILVFSGPLEYFQISLKFCVLGFSSSPLCKLSVVWAYIQS